MFVRIIYATVQAFLNNPSNPNHNTWVYLGLLLIPDFISVTIYTVIGYLIKLPSQLSPLEGGYAQKDIATPMTAPSERFEATPEQQPYQAQEPVQDQYQAPR